MNTSRRLAFGVLAVAGLALLAAAPASAAHTRQLALERPAAGIDVVSLDAGVGDIQIRASASDRIVARVELRSKDGWFRGDSSARAVDEAAISAELRGGRLEIEIDAPRRRNGGFEENWTIEIPTKVGFALDLGVGDVTVADVDGEVDLEVGVGDISISGRNETFGEIDAESGVGELSLRQPNGRHEKDGILGNHLAATGAGRARVAAEVGVGDIGIDLR